MQYELYALSAPTEVRGWGQTFGLTQGAARRLVGGLSSPGKMPCHSYGLPAAECGVGSRLRAVHTKSRPNVCGGCYALKGQYVIGSVPAAQYRRLDLVRAACTGNGDEWVRAMVCLIGWTSRRSGVFRWHDSGDIQSLEHLSLIVRVADCLPWVTFWIPTRESLMVRDWIAEFGPVPANLIVRESMALVGRFPRADRDDGRLFSAVAHKGQETPEGMSPCMAYSQGGKCLDCRACWDPAVTTVVYPLH